MRTALPALLLLLAACGDPGVYEPYVAPDGALDLNATAIRVEVRSRTNLTQQLQAQGRTIDRLEVVARMRSTDFAPTVNLPSDPTRPLVQAPLGTAVQDESSSQPTATVTVRGYPTGSFDVQVRAFSKQDPVGVGCTTNFPLNGSSVSPIVKVPLSSNLTPCLP